MVYISTTDSNEKMGVKLKMIKSQNINLVQLTIFNDSIHRHNDSSFRGMFRNVIQQTLCFPQWISIKIKFLRGILSDHKQMLFNGHHHQVILSQIAHRCCFGKPPRFGIPHFLKIEIIPLLDQNHFALLLCRFRNQHCMHPNT